MSCTGVRASAGSASQTFSAAAAHRGGVQRVGAHVALRAGAGGRRGQQGHAQALARQRQRGGQAHGAAAAHQTS
jgi:hypothetical protein